MRGVLNRLLSQEGIVLSACAVLAGYLVASSMASGDLTSTRFSITFAVVICGLFAVMISWFRWLERQRVTRLEEARRELLPLERVRETVFQQVKARSIPHLESTTLDSRLTGSTAEFFTLFSE